MYDCDEDDCIEDNYVYEGAIIMKNNKSKERQTTTKHILDIAFELGKIINSSNTDLENYQLVLDTLGKRLNWDYGELWFVEYSNNQIVKSDITFLDDKNSDFKKLANDYSHLAWNPDECIPGIEYQLWRCHSNFFRCPYNCSFIFYE